MFSDKKKQQNTKHFNFPLLIVTTVVKLYGGTKVNLKVPMTVSADNIIFFFFFFKERKKSPDNLFEM